MAVDPDFLWRQRTSGEIRKDYTHALKRLRLLEGDGASPTRLAATQAECRLLRLALGHCAMPEQASSGSNCGSRKAPP